MSKEIQHYIYVTDFYLNIKTKSQLIICFPQLMLWVGRNYSDKKEILIFFWFLIMSCLNGKKDINGIVDKIEDPFQFLFTLEE